MIVECISDLHGYRPDLEGGDLLLIGGDWTESDTEQQYFEFLDWVADQKHRQKVLIAGNHDMLIQKQDVFKHWLNYTNQVESLQRLKYLCDSSFEFEGLIIYGSPWTVEFDGMNPLCKGFTVRDDKELSEKWESIPKEVDILMTHTPPFTILDRIVIRDDPLLKYPVKNVGSESLYNLICLGRRQPILHMFGHIHKQYGAYQFIHKNKSETLFLNVSYVDETYDPVNKPKRVEITC